MQEGREQLGETRGRVGHVFHLPQRRTHKLYHDLRGPGSCPSGCKRMTKFSVQNQSKFYNLDRQDCKFFFKKI